MDTQEVNLDNYLEEYKKSTDTKTKQAEATPALGSSATEKKVDWVRGDQMAEKNKEEIERERGKGQGVEGKEFITIPKTEFKFELPSGEMSRVYDVDQYVPEEFIEHWIPELPAPEGDDVLCDSLIKDTGYKIPKTVKLPHRDRSGNQINVIYELGNRVGQGGMGEIFAAKPISEEWINPDTHLAEPIKDLKTTRKPIVLKICSDRNMVDLNKRLVLETGKHATLNPNPVTQPEFSEHVQWSQKEVVDEKTGKTDMVRTQRYKCGRSVERFDKVPAFEGAAKIHFKQETVYITGLEYIPGKPLSHFVAEKERGEPGLSVTDAMRMMTVVFEGLAEMHARGIVHRDIKPGNIMGTKKDPDKTRILDLGLSKNLAEEMIEAMKNPIIDPAEEDVEPIYDTSGSVTMAGRVMGTPRYMDMTAAERGGDNITDLFAAGKTTLEIMGLLSDFGEEAKERTQTLNMEGDKNGVPEKQTEIPLMAWVKDERIIGLINSINLGELKYSRAELDFVELCKDMMRLRFPKEIEGVSGLGEIRRKAASSTEKNTLSVHDLMNLRAFIERLFKDGKQEVAQQDVQVTGIVAKWSGQGELELSDKDKQVITEFFKQPRFKDYLPVEIEQGGAWYVADRMREINAARDKELGITQVDPIPEEELRALKEKIKKEYEQGAEWAA